MEPANRCEECGKEILRGYEGVHFGESADSPARLLCIGCYNREMAARAGIYFQHPNFSSVELADAEGNKHLFYFATRLLGDQVAIEAYDENADPGYQFNVLGRHEEVQRLFYKLKGRIQRTLTLHHIVEEDSRLTVSDDLTVRGRIVCDDETAGEQPLLVVDGKTVTWGVFGKMLSSFEGWQFKLTIYDRTEER
jgi:hypothetical protein